VLSVRDTFYSLLVILGHGAGSVKSLTTSMKNTYCLFQIKFITEYTNVQHVIITIESASGQSMKANGREPISCLGQVFNFKLDHFVMYAIARHIQKPLT
jgi:hypothetical protein